MTKNEIKNALYREGPEAELITGIRVKDNFTYFDTSLNCGTVINFKIPINEAKGFDDTMPAHLLIRWMV